MSAPRRIRRRAAGVALDCIEAGAPGAPLVILLHGFPEDAQSWRPQIDALASAGLHVVAPDQRGYGASDRPQGRRAYALDRLVDDVLALADDLGAARFSLVGHDWGGAVAFASAARSLERISRLTVLNAPHPGAMAAYALRTPTQMLRSSYMALFQLPGVAERLLGAGGGALLGGVLTRTAEPGAFDPAGLARLRVEWTRPGALSAMLAWYRAIPLMPQVAGRVSCDTLILWGRRDVFLEPGLAEASARRCEAAEIVWLEAGHWLHREAPQIVNRHLVDFLASKPELIDRV